MTSFAATYWPHASRLLDFRIYGHHYQFAHPDLLDNDDIDAGDDDDDADDENIRKRNLKDQCRENKVGALLSLGKKLDGNDHSYHWPQKCGRTGSRLAKFQICSIRRRVQFVAD